LFNAALMQGFDLVTQAADLRGDQFGPLAALRKKGARVGRKGHYTGAQVLLTRHFIDAMQDGLMAQMDPVKIANGDSAAGRAVAPRQRAIEF